MTKPTPHGQVPEALRLANLCSNLTRYSMDAHLIAAELRRQHARIAELEAVGAGGVQALSAAPGVTSEQRRLIGVIADKIEDGTLFQSGIYPKKDLARFVRNMLDTTPTAPAASPTPPAEQQATKETSGGFHVWRDISTAPKDGSRFVATGHNYGLYSEVRHTCVAQWFRGCWMEASDWNETSELKYLTHWMPLPSPPDDVAAPAEQQAAPKAALVEQDDHQILAITTAYEQGVGKGHQAYKSGKEITNPYSPAYRCDLAWQYGYKEGKEQAQREAKAAPQPALGVGNSGFDYQTAADFLSGKTVIVEALREFVHASRQAHDEKTALSATLLAMHGVLTSREAEIALLKKALLEAEAAPQQEAQEPVAYVHVPHSTVEGKVRPVVSFEKYQQDYADGIYSTRIPLYTAPQPAPAPLSEMPYEKRKAIQEGEQIGASDAWFHARHNMLDTLDRRNIFRAGFDRGWNAALAAQGGE